MAEDMFITALVYFSASLVVSPLVGRFIALQDTHIEGDAVGPIRPHWNGEAKGGGQVEAGRFAEVYGTIAGEDKT